MIPRSSACALGSRHGFAGVGAGFDGQSYVAILSTLVPTGKGRVIICGGGTKDAVTVCEEFMVILQGPVPEQAPSHPPNVEGCVTKADRLTTVPGG